MINPSFFFLLLGVWYPSGASYEFSPILITDNLEDECNHMKASACIDDRNGRLHIITSNPHGYAHTGCTSLTHEYYHLVGYQENEIPRCMP